MTKHARERMRERAISEAIIRVALLQPTEVSSDTEGRLLVKKLYQSNRGKRILLIAGEPVNNKLKIFTVIDSSKVKKYL
ncbi:MAG: DUF4258 domain-containing protein [Patescibacteria group bacterium]